MYAVILQVLYYSRVYLRFIFSNKYPYRLIVAIFIGLMYGYYCLAWNTFMAGQIDPAKKKLGAYLIVFKDLVL